MSIQRHITNQRLSEAVKANGFIFLAGQVPTNPEGDAEAQTANVLAQIDTLLQDLGSDESRILGGTIYIAGLASYEGLNRAWDAWVPAGHAPARACVKADLANPDWLVEIKLTALA